MMLLQNINYKMFFFFWSWHSTNKSQFLCHWQTASPTSIKLLNNKLQNINTSDSSVVTMSHPCQPVNLSPLLITNYNIVIAIAICCLNLHSFQTLGSVGPLQAQVSPQSKGQAFWRSEDRVFSTSLWSPCYWWDHFTSLPPITHPNLTIVGKIREIGGNIFLRHLSHRGLKGRFYFYKSSLSVGFI